MVDKGEQIKPNLTNVQLIAVKKMVGSYLTCKIIFELIKSKYLFGTPTSPRKCKLHNYVTDHQLNGTKGRRPAFIDKNIYVTIHHTMHQNDSYQLEYNTNCLTANILVIN